MSMSSASNDGEMNSGSLRSDTVRSFKVMDVLRVANELQQKLDRDHADAASNNNDSGSGTDTGVAAEQVLHLEVGQPETGAPKNVVDAAVEALTTTTVKQKKNVMGYTDAFGLLELRQRIRQHYVDKYSSREDGDNKEKQTRMQTQMQIPEVSQIVVTTGSSGAFLLAFTGCFDSNDTVAIASSGYPCYRNILQALGCQIATIPINDEYKLTATELKREIEERRQQNNNKDQQPTIKGLILSSPSNPTGSMLTPLELRELCELCNEENIIFISDEIYHGISYGNVPEATALQYATANNNANNANAVNENIIVINSFSKYYSMPGWRLGWMIVPPRFVQTINKLQQNMFINAPTVSQTAALKCWDEDTIQELETHVTKYRANRELILSRFEQQGGNNDNNKTSILLKGLTLEQNVAPADGGFYVYVDLGDDNICVSNDNGNDLNVNLNLDLDLDSVTMCEQLLAQFYVAFTPGIDFEDPDCSKHLGRRRFRISYAGGTENICKAMDKFTEFWNTVWLVKIDNAKNNKNNK